MVLDDEDVEKITEGLIQMSPPTLVSCTSLLGIPLSDWVYIATIVYTFVGAITIIKRHWIDPYFEAKRRLKEIEKKLKEEENDYKETKEDVNE